jgi:nucleoside-diphosphate-sugar epimerase
MTYLITGGAGFIGSHLARALIKRRQKVKIIDNLSTGRLENLTSVIDKIEFIRGDITDLALLNKHFKSVDFVLHHAALTSVPLSIEQPELTNLINVSGTFNVLIAARDCRVKRVIFASSSAVYGNSSKQAQKNTETDTPAPVSPYALSKLIGEQYCRLFFDIYNLETICLRYFNVFGQGQDPNAYYASVIPKFIQKLAANQLPTIFGTGNQSRDFVYVDDVVRANLLACHSGSGVGEVLNVGSGRTVSVNQIYKVLSRMMGKKNKPIFAPPRPGDVFKTLADVRKARKILGFQAQVRFEEGLRSLSLKIEN